MASPGGLLPSDPVVYGGMYFTRDGTSETLGLAGTWETILRRIRAVGTTTRAASGKPYNKTFARDDDIGFLVELVFYRMTRTTYDLAVTRLATDAERALTIPHRFGEWSGVVIPERSGEGPISGPGAHNWTGDKARNVKVRLAVREGEMEE